MLEYCFGQAKHFINTYTCVVVRAHFRRQTLNWLAAPINQICDCRLAAGGTDEHGNLASVIGRVAKELSEDVLDSILKPTGVQTLIF